LQTVEERKAATLGTSIERRIFSDGDAELRWSRFKQFEPRKMYEVVDERVFPFLRAMAENGSPLAAHMRDARLAIPTPALLAKVIDKLDAVPMDDRDTKGDVYEYMLAKIASAGQNGQFRTPRHIIALMVELVAPTPQDTVCDPAVNAGRKLTHPGVKSPD